MTDQADMEARVDQIFCDLEWQMSNFMPREGESGWACRERRLRKTIAAALSEERAAAYARAAEVARGGNVIEAIARAICEADGYDPDEDVIAGQAAAFENYGPRWQAMQRSEGQLGTTDYVAFANAALAALPKLNEAIAEARAQAFNEAAELSRGMILYDAETIANAIEALGEAKG